MTEDETIHGIFNDGTRVVRRDRAGKWYLRMPDDRLVPIGSVRQAAEIARAGTPIAGVPGGKLFDRIVREFG